jgi:hypothetical protein
VPDAFSLSLYDPKTGDPLLSNYSYPENTLEYLFIDNSGPSPSCDTTNSQYVPDSEVTKSETRTRSAGG